MCSSDLARRFDPRVTGEEGAKMSGSSRYRRILLKLSGEALLGELERRAFERVPNVYLCVSDFNVSARASYASVGYEEVGLLSLSSGDYACLDPLLDDSIKLAEKLKAANVPHGFDLYEGVIHGFLNMSRELEIGRKAIADAGKAIKEILSA